MLFRDKLPQDLYTAFQIIKLLIEKGNLNLIHKKICLNIPIAYQGKENWINYIMRCNSWTTKPDFTYLHYIYQISSIQALLHFNISIYKKQEKLIYDFILYTRNFLHKMGSRYCINNENENKQ